jgi:Cof subfamily protein (haloacid dehalogenase superfamily)
MAQSRIAIAPPTPGTEFIGAMLGPKMLLRPKLDWLQQLSKVRLVLMDIDGTLISANRTTFHNVIEQLKKLKVLGIEFSLATGRTIRGAGDVLAALQSVRANMPPMIAYNGAVIFSGRDAFPLQTLTIDTTAFGRLIEHCRHRGYRPLAYTCQPNFDLEPNDVFRGYRFPDEKVFSEMREPIREFNGMHVEAIPDLIHSDKQFVAVLIDTIGQGGIAAMSNDLLQELGNDLRITTSGGRYIEVCHPLGTKSEAMKKLARLNALDLTQIMSIGDNYNDLEMIESAGVGVAVANAPAAVRDAAMLVCSRAAAEGVVEALRVLVRSNRSSPTPHGLSSVRS